MAVLHLRFLVVAMLCAANLPCAVQAGTAAPDSMLRTLPGSGFSVRVLFTVGDSIGAYRPPGRLDGLGAWRVDADTLRIYVNHELPSTAGYAYRLANGTALRGSRISFFDLDLSGQHIRAAGLAYDAIRDRRGRLVTDPAQVSERPGKPDAGLDALCSATPVSAGEYGFRDDLLLAHEEVSALEDHPHGGSVWALDIRGRELWALPALGRGSWENAAPVAAPPGYVALLLGDDLEFGRAPLYLYIGRQHPGEDFPGRNGLRDGRLHAWVADGGARSPADWHGTGARRSGRFVPIAVRDPARAGEPGHDAFGYRDDTTLRAAAWDQQAFVFSRPEDLHTNSANPLQVLMASTGHGKAVPVDDWGTLYLIDLYFGDDDAGYPSAGARLTILYDGDDYGDAGIRSPDNLSWASDGLAYIQEDKATKRGSFGRSSGIEASVWRLDPLHPEAYQRIAVIDRSVLLPSGVRDAKAGEFGAWESSGVIDVSPQLQLPPERLRLLLTVQAHGIFNGAIRGRRGLVEGGQLLMLSRDP